MPLAQVTDTTTLPTHHTHAPLYSKLNIYVLQLTWLIIPPFSSSVQQATIYFPLCVFHYLSMLQGKTDTQFVVKFNSHA